MKNTKEFLKANGKHPNMGLNNTICKHPKYWCRLHQVWLSSADVTIKNCNKKLTSDMIMEYRCPNLENRSYKEFVRKMKGEQL